MTFMRKILDALNMDNWESEDDAPKALETNKKEKTLFLLRSKIDSANHLIDKARNAKNEVEFDNCINEIKLLFSSFTNSENREKPTQENKINNPYDKYYENLRKQRESNLNISYEDIKFFDKKPFDLEERFISDGAFTAIELFGKNLDIAYIYLRSLNNLISIQILV